jgi:2-methylcitrate dehydratase
MFRDPRILAFMKKITVGEDPSLTARQGASAPTCVTAVLADGQRISREVDYAPGFAKSPMSRADVEMKFRGNVGERWLSAQTNSVLEALWQLDRIDDLAAFLSKLSVRPKS